MMRPTALALLALLALACGRPSATRPDDRPRARPEQRARDVLRGRASYYGDYHHGRKTASGERFDMHELTAAHRTLPFGTRVRVTNLTNGRSVVVRINDRGPFGRKRRIIDLSKAAARKLHMLRAGVVPVQVEILR